MAGGLGVGAARRPRRNLRWIAAGVLAVSLGALGAALLYSDISRAVTVVTVNRTVYRDQVITEADLGITSAVPATGLEMVPSEQLASVIGRTAQLDLTQGTLLSPRSFGDPVTEPGQVRLGLRLAAGRIPSAALPPGARVLLVPIGRDGADPPPGASVVAKIATAAAVLPDGASIVDVSIAESEAERVARLAAADQVVLVQLPGVPR